MYHLYLQNKNSKKKFPATGTEKYPLYYVGTADVIDEKVSVIKIDPRWNEWMRVLSLLIDSKKYRAYVCNENSGKWIENFRLEFSA